MQNNINLSNVNNNRNIINPNNVNYNRAKSNFTFLRNNPKRSNLNSYQKLNQTYKINNNINKNYFITYDMKKMKFNFNNNNLNDNFGQSDNEMYRRKFSQSTQTYKNKSKN